jgi:hypothetical protein
MAVRIVAGERRRRSDRMRPAALFLDPRLTKLALTETMSGSAHLDADHRYLHEVSGVRGAIKVTAMWARAHTARVEDHRRRHRIPEGHDLQISSGALVVRGPARLTLDPDKVEPVANPATVLLAPATGDHPVLRSADGHGNPRWEFSIDYDVTPPELGWTPPIWITPAISPRSDRRALDLEVQWRTHDPRDNTAALENLLESKRIERLRITFPAEWGEVRGFSQAEQVVIGAPTTDGTRSIEWSKPPIKRSSRGRCHLSVAFESRIRPDDVVTGELDMRFHRTLSGAERVQFYAAGGARRQDGARCTAETIVELAFDLSLAGARYQDVRAVPDPVLDANEPKLGHKRFNGVVADHHTVAQLTNVLSREGYYVKRVVENPPQPGKEPGVLNRFWDLAGRRYTGVHPIDFHLVITGEEAEIDSTVAPTTTVRLAVRGPYATPDMEQRIVHEQELLWQRVVSSMDSAASGADGGKLREADEPIDAASAEFARLHNVALSLRTLLEIGKQTGNVNSDLAAKLIGRIDEEFGLGDSERG